MKQQQQEETWSEALVRLLKSSKEKDRIAQELGCSVRTLNRLIKGEHVRGGLEKLRQLTALLPQEHQQQVKDLLSQAFPSLFLEEEVVTEIPSVIYELVHKGLALLSESLRQQSLYDFILQNMLKQLDQDRASIAVQLFLCQLGEDGLVRGLLLLMQYGTGIWSLLKSQPRPRLFAGEGTLAARAVLSRQAAWASSASSADILPSQATWIMAYPLLRGEQVGGAIIVSSFRPDHFTSPKRLKVLEDYSHLLATITEEFFPQTALAFSPLPPPSVQLELLRSFQKEREEKLTREHDAEAFS